MRIYSILFLLLTLAGTALANERPDWDLLFNKLVTQLVHNDFETRERASHILATKFPKEFVVKYLEAATRAESPEIEARLFRAAKKLFLSKILPENPVYKQLFGTLGIECSWVYDSYCEDDDTKGQRYASSHKTHTLVLVTYPESHAEQQLKQYDIIIEVDGKSANDFFDSYHIEAVDAIPEKEYVIKIRRYKKWKDLSGISYYDSKKDKDLYDEIEVKVKAMTKENNWLDDEKIYKAQKEHWRNFVAAWIRDRG